MKKVIRTKWGKFKGVLVRPGQVLTVDDKEASAMVEGNVAKYAKGEEPKKAPKREIKKAEK